MDQRDRAVLREVAAGLLRPEERLLHADWRLVLETAVDRYLALLDRPDVRELFASGRRWHEVPVTIIKNGQRTRGSIDTLILVDSPPPTVARTVVLEFKTGAPLQWHRTQLDQYVTAARELLPSRAVEGILIYGESAPT